jgi:hypothetical protein
MKSDEGSNVSLLAFFSLMVLMQTFVCFATT